MLDFKQIQKEYSFLNDEIFLDVSRVVMPPLCVQNVYSSFMKEYICDFNSDIFILNLASFAKESKVAKAEYSFCPKAKYEVLK